MKKIIKALPHIMFILSLMFITFWILDKFNPTMNLINCSMANKLMIIFLIVTVINSISLMVLNRKS